MFKQELDSLNGSSSQVEITPEMVEAGVRVCMATDPDYPDTEGLVRNVFSAMLSLYLAGPSESPSGSHSRPS